MSWKSLSSKLELKMIFPLSRWFFLAVACVLLIAIVASFFFQVAIKTPTRPHISSQEIEALVNPTASSRRSSASPLASSSNTPATQEDYLVKLLLEGYGRNYGIAEENQIVLKLETDILGAVAKGDTKVAFVSNAIDVIKGHAPNRRENVYRLYVARRMAQLETYYQDLLEAQSRKTYYKILGGTSLFFLLQIALALAVFAVERNTRQSVHVIEKLASRSD